MSIATEETLPALEALDVSNDTAQLNAMLDTLKLLAQFQVSFNDQKAVCQAQIKTLIENCDIALDDRYPLKSFTQAPSPQNLQVATESVLKRSGEVIKAFIKKAVEIIKQMIAWIRAAIKNFRARSGSVYKRVTITKAIHEANAELKPILASVPNVPSDEEVTAAHAKLAAAIREYTDYSSGLAQSMLTEGPYLGLLKAIAFNMPKVVGFVNDKMAIAEKVFDELKDPMVMAKQLSTLAEPLPSDAVGTSVTKLPNFQNTTLLDFFENLYREAKQMHEDHPKPMEWSIASAVVVDSRSGLAEPILPIPDEIDHVYGLLMERVEKLLSPNIQRFVDKSLSAHVDAAFTALVGDVQSLTIYAQIVNLFLDTQAGLVNALYKCEAAQFELYRTEGKVGGDAKVVERINAVQHHLRDLITRR